MKDVAQEAADSDPASLDPHGQPFSKDASVTVDQHRALVMQSLGENIQVKRDAHHAKSFQISP